MSFRDMNYRIKVIFPDINILLPKIAFSLYFAIYNDSPGLL